MAALFARPCRQIRDEARANAPFAPVSQRASPSGLLYATPELHITALHSRDRYRPCLAVAAWAVIASSNRNPYLPKS